MPQCSTTIVSMGFTWTCNGRATTSDPPPGSQYRVGVCARLSTIMYCEKRASDRQRLSRARDSGLAGPTGRGVRARCMYNKVVKKKTAGFITVVSLERMFLSSCVAGDMHLALSRQGYSLMMSPRRKNYNVRWPILPAVLLQGRNSTLR
jgi:hypothetical protein